MLFLATVALGAPLIPGDADGWQGPKDPSTTKDPDIVCVSFKEGLSEDWCYAACTNGICPPEATGDCMCGKGTPKQQQQGAQASQQGMTKDWASGAILPKAPEAAPLVAPKAAEVPLSEPLVAPTAVAVAPSAVAVAPAAELPNAPAAAAAVAEDGTPLPSLAAPTDPTCVSLKTGTPDFWCQNTCGAKTNYCPEDTCKCGEEAVKESQANAAAAMDAWNEAEAQNRALSDESNQAEASPAAQPPAITAADAWAAAAAQVPPEPVAAISPATQPAGPDATQPTDAWKAAAEAASKPQVAVPLDTSPLPAAAPVLTPEAAKVVAERDANTAARDADIASRPVTEDWVAQAKADMDKVMADRDAEIASRTDGTSVPVSAVSPA